MLPAFLQRLSRPARHDAEPGEQPGEERGREPGGERPLRLLLATDAYPPEFPPEPGGVASCVRGLALELASRGHDVHVVCHSPYGPPLAGPEKGVTVHRLRSVPLPGARAGRVALPILLTGTLERVVGRIAPDVAHVHGAGVVARTVIAVARAMAVPLVATAPVMTAMRLMSAGGPPMPAALSRTVARMAWRDLVRLLGGADHVTVPGQAAARLLARRGLTATVEPIPYGVDLSHFRPPEEPRARARGRLGLPERATVLSVGRLDAVTRPEDLVRALPYVCRRIDAQVVFAGTGRRRPRLERLADRAGLTGRVHVLGPVSDGELPIAYAAADVVAVPGTAAGAGGAALQAMACGVPVVAARGDMLAPLVPPDGTGRLYEAGDICALARCLTAILADAGRASTMGGVCRAVAVIQDRVRSATRFEEIYARLAEARRPV
jgi:glycosyltransferase involved in cell wall biosynthesis